MSEIDREKILGKDSSFKAEELNDVENVEQSQSAKDIIEKLQPETITDEDGIERTVYTFTNDRGLPVKVMFYLPEETPNIHNAIQGQHIFVYGEQPRWRDKEDWNEFISSVEDNTEGTRNVLNPGIINPSEKNEIFLVENRIDKMLDMAFALGLEDEGLRDLRKQLVQENLASDKSEEILDQIIAAKMIDDSGNLKDHTDTEGEALMLLALQGDEASQFILKRKLERLLALEEKNRIDELTKEKENFESMLKGREGEPLPQEKLVAVHLTKYPPKHNPIEKSWDIQTTFDATQGGFPRITVHTSLNHAVEPAGISNSWEDMPIAAISPLNKLIEKNGKPAVLNTVDTVFEVSPGRRLHIPEDGSVMIRPGKIDDPVALFEKKSDNEIVYTEEVLPSHIEQLTSELDEFAILKLNAKIREGIYSTFSYYDEKDQSHKLNIPEEDFESLIKILGIRAWQGQGNSYGGKIYDDSNTYDDLLPALKESKISDWVQGKISEAGLSEKLSPSITGKITTKLNAEFVRTIKKKAINETIEELGYTVQPGGHWSWADDDTIDSRTKALALEMGVRSGAHNDDISKALEEVTTQNLNRFVKGFMSPKEYRDHVTAVNLGTQSQAQLRMKYLMGAL